MNTSSSTAVTSNVNPLLTAANQLSSSLYLNFSSHAVQTAFNNQLYILSALLGFGLVLQLLSLVLRWGNGCLWICRRSGSYIVLNGTVAYTFWSSLYLGVLQGFIYRMKAYGEPWSDLRIPLLLGAWSMSWATYLAPILARQAYDPTSRLRSISLFYRPLAINSFFIAIPCFCIVTVTTFCYLLSTNFNTSFAEACELNEMVKIALAGGPLNVTEMEALKASLVARNPIILKQWQNVFINWTVFVALQLTIFTVSAIIHFLSLGSAISQLKLRRPPLKKVERMTFNNSMEALAWAYRGLVFTSTMAALLSASYFALDLTLAVGANQMAEGREFTQDVILVGLYLQASFGLLSALAIFFHSLTLSPSAAPGPTLSFTSPSSRFATPGIQRRFEITVQREVEVLSEGGSVVRKASLRVTPVAMSCLDEEFELELWSDPGLKEEGIEVYHIEGQPFAY